MRVEFEYQRAGALQYLAAWDVHRARLFGRCGPHTGKEPFERLAADVMTAEPYRSARRVFWIVDNGPSHRGRPSIARTRSSAWKPALAARLPAGGSPRIGRIIAITPWRRAADGWMVVM